MEVKAQIDKGYAENSDFIHKMFDNSPTMIYIHDFVEHKNLYVNKAGFRIMGYSTEYVNKFGINFFKEHAHPEDLHWVEEYNRQLVTYENASQPPLEYRLKDIYGNWHWVLVTRLVFSRTESGTIKEVLNNLIDITAQKNAEAELKKSLDFISKISNASPDVIYVLDIANMRFIYLNDSFKKTLGLTIDEIYDEGIDLFKRIIDPKHLELRISYLKNLKTLEDNEIRELEYCARAKDGCFEWFKSRDCIFQKDENGVVIQVMGITQNIQAKKIAEDIEKEKLVMQKLLIKKDEFMSVASHELKTPITTLKASIQIIKRLIEKKTDYPTLLTFAERSNQQMLRLTGLIGDLMDNAKINAGQLQLNLEWFHISELLGEAITHISDKHTFIINNLANKLVQADQNKIEQVLTNFIANAVKYSPNGKQIIINVSTHKDCLHVSVTDFGIGISKDKIMYLFQRYYRASENSNQFSGLGLGLFISSEIIKQHQGEYGVESEEGKGSTFWFKIPLHQ